MAVLKEFMSKKSQIFSYLKIKYHIQYQSTYFMMHFKLSKNSYVWFETNGLFIVLWMIGIYVCRINRINTTS